MKHQIGAWGEEIAGRYLERCGYQILTRNFHSRQGEIDIIALDPEGALVFTEVKTRSIRNVAESGERSVDFRKRRKNRLAAMFFLSQQEEGVYDAYRFDVIVILYSAAEKNKVVLRHYKAVEG